MATNIERFGKLMSGRATKTAKDAIPTTIELGQLDGNLALTTDTIKTPIPKGDYLVPLMTTGDFLTEDTSPSCSEGGTCTHNHRLPENEYRSLQPGDRVLVAWCGNEPVIVTVVVPS